MLAAGLDFEASQLLGIEQQKRYIKIAENKILERSPSKEAEEE